MVISDKKDKIWFLVVLIGIVLLWLVVYSFGLLDGKLPDEIKEKNINQKVEKVAEKVELVREGQEIKEKLKKANEYNFLQTGIWGGLNTINGHQVSTENQNDSYEKNNKASEKNEKTNDSLKNNKTKNQSAIKNPDAPVAVFETSVGKFELVLYKKLMPITVSNFEKLVKKGFYNKQRFHRVIPDFIIQAGDPYSKDLSKKELWGRSGPGYVIKDEFVKDSRLTNKKYTIAMANAGPNTGGSQFFINMKDNQFLDFDKQPSSSKHPVFGLVVSGYDTLDKIQRLKNGEVIIKEIYLR